MGSETSDPPTVRPTPVVRIAAARSSWAVGAYFVLAFMLWGLAMPPMSLPDEPAHTIRAAAIWHGQLRGEVIEVDSGNPAIPIPIRMFRVRVPKSYAEAGTVPGCFAFNSHASAACIPAVSGSMRSTEALTSAGGAPPAYYALVGWVTRVFSADVGEYVMRLITAAMCGLLVTAAFDCLRRITRPDLAFAAVGTAAVPMLYFLAGGVHPNGLEISAALAMWSSGLVLMRDLARGGGPLRRGPLLTYMISGFMFTSMRALSPLFASIVLVVTMLCAAGWSGTWSLLRQRRWWLVNAPLAVGAAGTVLWVLLAGGLESVFGESVPKGVNLAVFLLGKVDDYVEQAIGIFGWMDNGPIPAVTMTWLVAVGTLTAVAVVFARRLSRLVTLLALVVIAVFIPVVVQAPVARTDGVAWQGRYGLPLLVGIPLVALALGGPALSRLRRSAGRLALFLTALTSSAVLVAFVDTLQRFVVGGDGSPLFMLHGGGWQPPLGVALTCVAGVMLWIAPVVISWMVRGPHGQGVADDPQRRSSSDGVAACP